MNNLNILFVSKFSEKCINVLKILENNYSLKENLKIIFLDNKRIRAKIPIKNVPTLLIINNNNKIINKLSGSDFFNYLNSKLKVIQNEKHILIKKEKLETERKIYLKNLETKFLNEKKRLEETIKDQQNKITNLKKKKKVKFTNIDIIEEKAVDSKTEHNIPQPPVANLRTDRGNYSTSPDLFSSQELDNISKIGSIDKKSIKTDTSSLRASTDVMSTAADLMKQRDLTNSKNIRRQNSFK